MVCDGVGDWDGAEEDVATEAGEWGWDLRRGSIQFSDYDDDADGRNGVALRLR